jgi:hypothetical protein
MKEITASTGKHHDDYSAPRAMNRQVGPSIVLSVLIVCFFSVALFRHEPKRSVSDRAGIQGHRGQPGTTPSSSATHTDSGNRLAATATAGPQRAGPETAQVSARSSGQPGFKRSDRLAPTVRPASVRSEQALGRALGTNDGASEKPTSSQVLHQPRAAFTVVEQDEAIADVAVRIYGSVDAVDVLWRANRDSLPQKDSPLSAGTFLRTPPLR